MLNESLVVFGTDKWYFMVSNKVVREGALAGNSFDVGYERVGGKFHQRLVTVELK